MSNSDHLRIAIATSAQPEHVLAVLRDLTVALPATQPDFVRELGQPSLSTRPSGFTLRAHGMGYEVPVGWTGRVQAVPEGSLIVAETNRSGAVWQSAFSLLFLLAIVGLVRRTDVDSGNSLLMIPLMAIALTLIGWYRATHLPANERRKAIALRDLMLGALPNATLVAVPQSMTPE